MMATEVTIPNLGYTMTVAKILRFVKSVGDSVEAGETLFEIETDKVNYGIEAPVSGVVKAILRDEGDEVPVGGVVAIIGDRDEQVDLARYMGREGEGEGKAPEGERQEREVVSAARLEKGRVLASPVARKMARERGIDLTLIRGSGRSGRIRMADVERYLREVMTEGREIEAGPTSPEIAEVIPMTSMRATIARRLSRSFREAPHFNLFTEVDMTEVNRLRESTGDSIEAQAGTRLSINDILIKGAALVLREFPLLNARLVDEKIEVLKDIHIGLAVALDEGL
ncbi:MAG: 2-oxo acid dehydrogenase subunit E2, partial [Deltaproteobacteria bacterium]|nr:2-oxo acid dehydrogenase subunit E2 [Deltaproteobacteria bacterium]